MIVHLQIVAKQIEINHVSIILSHLYLIGIVALGQSHCFYIK